MRFMMGVTEAFIVIYAPVWVNNYSPLEYSTTWMGILHSCTALGVILGYVLASIIINFFGDKLTWRFAIQIQGFQPESQECLCRSRRTHEPEWRLWREAHKRRRLLGVYALPQLVFVDITDLR